MNLNITNFGLDFLNLRKPTSIELCLSFSYFWIKDDRVHPGHTRKMAAKMMDLYHTNVSYYENIEGGYKVQPILNKKPEWNFDF